MIYDMEQAWKEGLERFSSSSFPETFNFIFSTMDSQTEQTMFITFIHHYWRKTVENATWLAPEMVDFFVYYATHYLCDVPETSTDIALDILKMFASEIFEKRQGVVIPQTSMTDEEFCEYADYIEELIVESIACGGQPPDYCAVTVSIADQLCYETGYMVTDETVWSTLYDFVAYFLYETQTEEHNNENGQ